MARRGHIPAAFLQHPPPSWRARRHNPILDASPTLLLQNAKRRGVYLSPEWHRFVKRKPRLRKNPTYARNPGKGGLSMTMVMLLGGAAFLFLTPSGRALAARFTGGTTAVPAGVPAGSVQLADGTWRSPTGQIYGTPRGSGGYLAPLASLVPGVTALFTGWLRGLSDTSSATTVGGVPIIGGSGGSAGTVSGDPLGTGASTVTAPDILSGWALGEPLPPIPDLTLSTPGTLDFWSGVDTSGWWGNLSPIDPLAGPVPIVDVSLNVPYDWGYTAPADVSGFLGLGRVEHKYRFRQPSSFR